MTHYQTLGVCTNATAADIKKAYRKLASTHHPDKGGDVEDFKRIQHAYNVLSHDQRRADYDLYGDASPQSQRYSWQGYDDISKHFTDFMHKSERYQRMNPDVHTTVSIDLAQAYHGNTVMIDVHGRQHTLKIPPGTSTGNKYRIPGAGTSRYAEVPPGDLIVSIMIRHSNTITVAQQDIIMRVEINALEAMTGCHRVIDHVSGKHINVKIPAGTQPDSRLRLTNMGMPFKANPEKFGDMFIHVTVKIPTITAPDHIEWINIINQEVNS